MIQVCCYRGCGMIYGEKEPLEDKQVTHGLCPKHFLISLKEIKADREMRSHKGQSFGILIVEDYPPYRQLLRETLHHRFPSISIHEAMDGTEALWKVETLRPNIVFMDIRLPRGTGLQLSQEIKARHPGITIIILTAYDLPEYREAASVYADYFFSKSSLHPRRIFSLVESILPNPAA